MVEFYRSDGTKASIKPKRKRKASAKTIPELRKNIKKLPSPVLRKNACDKYLEARVKRLSPRKAHAYEVDFRRKTSDLCK